MTTQNALNTPAVSAMGEIASSVRLPWVVSRNTPPSASTIEPILRQARCPMAGDADDDQHDGREEILHDRGYAGGGVLMVVKYKN